MNRLFILLGCLCVINVAQAQNDSVKTDVKKDTTRITLGNKEIKIIETDEGTDIKVRKRPENRESRNFSEDKDKSDNFNDDKKHRSGYFHGHFDAIEFGYNGFLNSNHEMSLTGSDKFMSLNTNPTRSMNIGINFCQVNQAIFGRSFGLVTGLRFEFNNYFFENNNSIAKDDAGNIAPVYYDPIQVDKSKLTLLYFTIPVMFEFQLPANGFKHRLWISGGITGSIKLDSHTKVVYHENGKKQKDKNHDDFNINVLRYGFTARAGYSDFFVFANYYPTQLFEKDKGPELYQFSVGVGFHFH
jgi:hypothetical protein